MTPITDSKNVNTGEVNTAGGNFIQGDNTIINNLKEAAQYKTLEAEIQKLDERFEKTKVKIKTYPDDTDFQAELLEIDQERNQKQKDLETLKREVLKLAEEFDRIPINTERLKLAKLHFDQGEFKEARAVLDSEKMSTELDALLLQKENILQKASENESKLSDKANEYLILARLTAIDFDLPDRFEKTKGYFEQSLKAQRTIENLFQYADFLLKSKEFSRLVAVL